MLIKEILNTSSKFKVLQSNKTRFETIATINGRQIEFIADYFDDVKYWDISFHERGVDGHLDSTQTGSGKELEVFAMVKDSLLAFIEKYKPEKMEFSAMKDDIDKPRNTRAELYDKLLARFKIPGYNVERLKGRRKDVFIIKKDPNDVD